MIIALAALVVALAAIGAGVWRFRWAGPEAERTAVMVLPFANLSGDASVNQLAEAVTDGLTDALSRFSVRVIASDTAKAYAGKPIDVKQVGKDLGLRYLLGGSLQPTEARVRVSAQLIDGQSGVQLWAETFDEDRADRLQMEDEIVARIMNALRIRATDIEAERRFERTRAVPRPCAAPRGRATTRRRPSTLSRGRSSSRPAMRRCVSIRITAWPWACALSGCWMAWTRLKAPTERAISGARKRT